MKKLLFTIAALFCTTLSFAQEYMVIENTAGGWTSIDVSVISQAYFKTFPATGQGTKENPFNVAAANAKCKEIGTEPSAEKYYVKGIVVSVGSNSDGTAAYIADDESAINRLYIYKLTLPEGITVNRKDEVIMYGALYHYRNVTTEMEGVPVSINGQAVSGDPIADVIAGEDSVTYSVRGEVTKIENTTYGNFYVKDETGEIYIYGTLDAAGATKNFASLGIEVGDTVTVMGPKKTYNGTPELVNVKVIKIEKQAKGSGTLSDPYNVQAALDYINTLGADTPSEQAFYIKGYVTSIINQFDTYYGNATFNISDTKSGVNSLMIYRSLYLGNVNYTEGTLLNEGDEVIIYGKVTNYKGITPETVQGSYLYSLNGKTEIENGGGTQGGDTTIVTPTPSDTTVVSSDPISVAQALEIINGYADNGSSKSEVTVKGKIVSVQSYNSTYKSITYYISDDGTETNRLLIYSGKGLNGAEFASKEDLTVGMTVTVKGTLKKYVNSTVIPEMDKNSVILAIE